MNQNYNIRVEIDSDAIRDYSETDRKYIREKVKNFDWSSLPVMQQGRQVSIRPISASVV